MTPERKAELRQCWGDQPAYVVHDLLDALDERDAKVARLESLFQRTHGVHHSWVAEVERLRGLLDDALRTMESIRDNPYHPSTPCICCTTNAADLADTIEEIRAALATPAPGRGEGGA